MDTRTEPDIDPALAAGIAALLSAATPPIKTTPAAVAIALPALLAVLAYRAPRPGDLLPGGTTYRDLRRVTEMRQLADRTLADPGADLTAVLAHIRDGLDRISLDAVDRDR